MKISHVSSLSTARKTKLAGLLAVSGLAVSLLSLTAFAFPQVAQAVPPTSSVLPSKGQTSVQQLPTKLKAPTAPKTDQAALEAKINAALIQAPASSSSSAASTSHLSLFPLSSASTSASNSASNAPASHGVVVKEDSSGPASSSSASIHASVSSVSTAKSDKSDKSDLVGASGIPFKPQDNPSTNTVLRANDVQAEVEYQKSALSLDKIIQARVDFAKTSAEPKAAPGPASAQGFGRLAEPGSKINNLAPNSSVSNPQSGNSGSGTSVATAGRLNFRVTSIATFGKRQSVEMTLPDGTDTIASPGDKLPISNLGGGTTTVRVGSIHDGGVNLTYDKHSHFYPVVAGTPDLPNSNSGGAGNFGSRSSHPTAIPPSAPPAQAPMALPPIPHSGGATNSQ